MSRGTDQNKSREDASTRQTAIAELYHRHASALLLYLRHHTASIEDAEDMLLEIFTAALVQERLLALPESVQRMWLWRVARNKLADTYRQQRWYSTTSLEKTLSEQLVDNELVPEQQLLRQEEDARLHQAIQQLSPLQQEMLSLRFVQNRRCSEIGMLLGKSEKAIRSLLARTLNRLRSTYGTRQEN